MPRVSLLGGAYSAASVIASAQRSVNLYPEENLKTSQAPVNVTHYPRPGLTPFPNGAGLPTAQANGRCCYTATNGDGYVVVGQTVYYVDQNYNYTAVGTLVSPATTPVVMADNGSFILVVDGSTTGYSINLSTKPGVMLQIGDPNFPGANRVDFLDDFLIYNQLGANGVGTPNWGSTFPGGQLAFNALSFGTKTAWPDNITAVIAVERQAWLFGPYKGEVWQNAGLVPFAFQIISGNIVEHGLAAIYSLAKQDVNIYWVSQSPEGSFMAMRGTNLGAQRISTHAIEEEWRNYPTVADAIGMTYQLRGHAFYKIHFPTADKTWGFDESTQQWHEDNFCDVNGVLHRSRISFCSFMYGKNVGLDWNTGQLYLIDETNFTDNNQPIVCIRSMPHFMDEEYIRVTYNRVIADVETGTGTGTLSVPTSQSPWSVGFSNGFGPRTLLQPPEISLRVSRTRGEKYGNAVVQPMGAAGLYTNRPTWRILGYGTDIVIELSWSTPMKTALNGVVIEFEKHEADI